MPPTPFDDLPPDLAGIPARLLSMKDICALTRRSKSTIDRWIEAEKFPRPRVLPGASNSPKAWLLRDFYVWAYGLPVDEGQYLPPQLFTEQALRRAARNNPTRRANRPGLRITRPTA